MTRLLALLFAVGPLATAGYGQSDFAAIDDALVLEVPREGLARLADRVQIEHLNELGPIAIPDQVQYQGRRTVVSRGMVARAQIPEIDIEPGDGFLEFSVHLSDFIISIPQIEIHGRRSTYCHNTRVVMAHRRPIPLIVRTYVVLNDGRLEFSSFDSDFQLDPDNFTTIGPAECRGRLLRRPLLRSIVERNLRDSRSRFESMIVASIRDRLPGIAQTLNDAMTNTMQIEVSDRPVLRDMILNFHHQPSSLLISGEALRMGFTVDASRGGESLERRRFEFDEIVLVGQLRVHRDLINDTLYAMLADGSREFLADNDLFSDFDIEDMITTDVLGEFWPELWESHIEDVRVKPYVRISSAPNVTFHEDEGKITLDATDLMIRLQVKVGGIWQDFFHLVADASVNVIPNMSFGDFVITLDPSTEITFDGEWAADYTPVDRTFNRDVLNQVMVDLVELLSDGDLAAFENPTFEVRSLNLTLGDVLVTDPYLSLHFVAPR